MTWYHVALRLYTHVVFTKAGLLSRDQSFFPTYNTQSSYFVKWFMLFVTTKWNTVAGVLTADIKFCLLFFLSVNVIPCEFTATKRVRRFSTLFACLCGSLVQCALILKRLSAGPGFNPQIRQNKLFQDYWRACFEINFSDRQEGLTVSSIICDR